VRQQPLVDPAGSRYVAWYAPDHLIVRRAAPFFAERFSGMRWSILTPDLSAHWDGVTLTFSLGVATPRSSTDDEEVATLWRTYYESMFNPSRVNARAMQRDMPARRWHRLPEATLIPRLLDTAAARSERVAATRSGATARPFVPVSEDLATLRAASSRCCGCRLHERATQTVFGDGPSDARLVLIGEQPGDEEDERGRPFIGPAGRILDAALAAADIARAGVYVTNAVKHFSFEPRGKRRIHETPRLSEMLACRPWLEAELHSIRPDTVVAMGATAARALLGPQARVMTLRGRVLEGLPWAPRVVVTVHPSAVLRSNDGAYFDMLVGDLRLAAQITGPRSLSSRSVV
jgi:DNA polymerase